MAGAAGAAVVGVPLLAACGGSGNGGGASAGSSPSTAAQGSPKRGGTLTVGVDGGTTTETLNPNYATTSAELSRATQLFDTLLYYTPDFQIANALAESVEPNSNATVWTIRLRPGVEFHNGKPFTANDVVYTLKEWILGKKNPGAAASHFNALDVGSIKVVDKLTLTLPFKTPFSPLPDVLAVGASNCVRIVPEGFDLSHPIGTGPFMYKSFTPGQQSEFVKNPNYWRSGRPYMDRVVITDINDDSARINAIMGGQVDAIIDVPATSIASLKSNSAITVLNSKTGTFNPITMRTDIPPFNDVRVRQAFRLMADRGQIVETALDGQGFVGNDLYAPFDPAYNHSLPQRVQDIDQAKSLLKAAGQEGLSVQLVTSDIAAGEISSCEAFAQQASAAGVKVQLQQVQPTQFWSQDFLKSKFSVSNWATRSYLVQAMDSMLSNSVYNETHWSDSRWDKLVSEAFATTSQARRTELIHEAQKIEWESGGYLIWGFQNTIDAYSSDMAGFVPNRTGLDLNAFGFADVWRS